MFAVIIALDTVTGLDDKLTTALYIHTFNTVDHDILLINVYVPHDIRGVTHDRFRLYLESRQQRAQFWNWASGITFNNAGVPQGSTLGPLLFIRNVNFIHRSENQSS